MEVLILTVFVSVALVIGELVFFAWNVRQGTHDHTDRLTLLPLENERRFINDALPTRNDDKES